MFVNHRGTDIRIQTLRVIPKVKISSDVDADKFEIH